MIVTIDIAPGEALDRLTILEIKLERIADPQKLANVKREYTALLEALPQTISGQAELAPLRAELKSVNAQLWEVEEKLRDHERRSDFGAEFVALARAVYRCNDRRALVKRQINALLGSPLIEEKSFPLT
jgi:alpha-mannosidase